MDAGLQYLAGDGLSDSSRAAGSSKPMLRTDSEGFLVRDGWSIYRQFVNGPAPTLRGSSATALPEMILPAAKSEAELPCTVRPSCNELCNCTLVVSKGRGGGDARENGSAARSGSL